MDNFNSGKASIDNGTLISTACKEVKNEGGNITINISPPNASREALYKAIIDEMNKPEPRQGYLYYR